jgi:glycosyltransferase involved in cell wall biosynthesis
MRRSTGNLRLPPEADFSLGEEIIAGLVVSPGIIALRNAEVVAAGDNEDLLPPDPHRAGHLVAFVDWLIGVPEGSSTYLPRYMEAVYNERPDLQLAMPEVRMGELAAFSWWSNLYGRFEIANFRVLGYEVPIGKILSEMEIIAGLVVSPGIIALRNAEVVAAGDNEDLLPPDPHRAGHLVAFVDWLIGVPEGSSTYLPRYMEAVYNERPDLQLAMPEVRMGELAAFSWWSYVYGRFEIANFRVLGHEVPIKRKLASEGRVSGGVDVIGFLNAEHGIGEAARLLVEALRAAPVSVSTIGFRLSESRQNVDFTTDELGRYKIVIAAINAELNKPVRELFGKLFFKDTYVIGQWFWELEVAPDWYADAYQYVDELWAPTKFIEDMLRREAPKRINVIHMPLPLRHSIVSPDVSRDQFDLDDKFMFLFTFDFMSVMKRKNPLGLVEAFKKAFSPNEGPVLVLKSINGESRPLLFAELMRACEGRSDIVIINKYLDSDKSAALMSSCDCYVSLHRSEGLGLTIAEAMLLGKPVIATGYSGNLDFMTDETSYLVPWTKVKVGDNAEAYSPDAMWAEPNLDVAAEMMRFVYENPKKARQVAQAGKRDLELRFTTEVTGLKMKTRLEHLWRQ